MALRVLLADESNAIKKVFQLALQDFAVNVKTVNLGPDVLETAKTFKPDIIFADVLLQKKNGYDVANELKTEKLLKTTPVVLMWSGFMELDQDKYQASRADAKLEKPFDVEALRQLVRNYVPKTQSQNLSKYLSFPKMPDIQEDEAQVKQKAASLGLTKKVTKPAPAHTPEPEAIDAESDAGFDLSSQSKPMVQSTEKLKQSSSWGMDNFDPIDNFEERPIQPSHAGDTEPMEVLDLDVNDEPDNKWVKKDISQFKVDPKVLGEGLPEANYVVPEDDIGENLADKLEHSFSGHLPPPLTPKKIKATTSYQAPENEADDFIAVEDEAAVSVNASGSQPSLSQMGLSPEDVRKIVREMVQDVVWKVVPDLAKELIEKELDRLLSEEKSP